MWPLGIPAMQSGQMRQWSSACSLSLNQIPNEHYESQEQSTRNRGENIGTSAQELGEGRIPTNGKPIQERNGSGKCQSHEFE
jgi:hypothetical protein